MFLKLSLDFREKNNNNKCGEGSRLLTKDDTQYFLTKLTVGTSQRWARERDRKRPETPSKTVYPLVIVLPVNEISKILKFSDNAAHKQPEVQKSVLRKVGH